MPRRLQWWERRRSRLAVLVVVGLLMGAGIGFAIAMRPDLSPGAPPTATVASEQAEAPHAKARPEARVLPGRPEPPPLPYFDEDPPAPRTADRGRIGFCRGRSGNDCVIDGDSFILAGETIRLAGIDAPEIGGAACRDERQLGQKAKERLHMLLNAGEIRLVATGDRDRDRFGRLLRDAHVDGLSVSEALMAEGLARPWRGRKESWC
ncbi:MAG: thermonuclease family protein [Thermaurantiacus sp.]